MLSMLPISQPVIRRHERAEFSVEPFRLLGVLAVTISRFSLPHPAGSFVPSGPIQAQSSQCRPARSQRSTVTSWPLRKNRGPSDFSTALSPSARQCQWGSTSAWSAPSSHRRGCTSVALSDNGLAVSRPKHHAQSSRRGRENWRWNAQVGGRPSWVSPLADARRTPWHVARVNQATDLASLSLASLVVSARLR